MKQFRNPASFSPPYAVQSPCSFSHVTEGYSQSSVEKGKHPLARSSHRRKPFVPNSMVSQIVLIQRKKQSPFLHTLEPWGPGKLGSTVQSDMQHIPPATTAGRMSSSRHLGFGHMHLTRKRHWSSISLSASCRSAERSYKCICTCVKFSLCPIGIMLG